VQAAANFSQLILSLSLIDHEVEGLRLVDFEHAAEAGAVLRVGIEHLHAVIARVDGVYAAGGCSVMASSTAMRRFAMSVR
jgi:hypothetical protein